MALGAGVIVSGGAGRWLFVAGAVNGALVVALGAYGAHAVVDPASRALFQTAVQYHMFHTLGLLALAALAGARSSRHWVVLSAWSMLAGVVLFCGALYLAAIAGDRHLIGMAPVGGGAFILGWVLFAVAAWRR